MTQRSSPAGFRGGEGSYILGLDAGTTAMKAALFDQAGRALGRASREYRLATPAPDRAEMEPQRYWQACCDCYLAGHQDALAASPRPTRLPEGSQVPAAGHKAVLRGVSGRQINERRVDFD